MADVILIVDDDEPTADVIKAYLTTEYPKQHTCVRYSAGRAYETLSDFQDCAVGSFLLISDFNLEKNRWIKNGAELAQLTQKRYPNAKIIIMSGRNKPREQCRKLGYSFLYKPFTLVALKAAVEAVMRTPHPVRDE